jgi:hypothetical protein
MALFQRRVGLLVHPELACNVRDPLLVGLSGKFDAPFEKGVVEAGPVPEGRASEAGEVTEDRAEDRSAGRIEIF